MEPAETRVIFMGSPAFAEPSLKALNAAGYQVPMVVTQPDKPAGRGSRLTPPPIKRLALDLGIDVYQPPSLRAPGVAQHIRDAVPDVLVVAAYGKIIPRDILDIPSRGSLNVHASLLPRWRGASPVAAAILAGDTTTGVSIMEVVAKMDAGPVVAATQVPIDPADTTGALEGRLAERGALLLVDTLPAWFDRRVHPAPQDETSVTYCSLIDKRDGELHHDMTADEAHRAVRAYNPWPGASVGYKGGRLAIWTAHVQPLSPEAHPGSLLIHERQPAIAFTGGLLVLDEVQRQGSRRMAGRDFLNGERNRLPETVDFQ